MRTRVLLPLVLAAAVLASRAAADALQVEEGVIVKFGTNGELVVRDGLFVVGGALFTSEADDSAAGPAGATPGTPAPGDWLGVRFEPSAMGAATRLEGLRIRYAGRGGAGALRLRGTGSTLFGFTIEDASGAGLFATGGATTALSQLAIRRTGLGVFVDAGSTISFTGSLIEQNTTGAAAATTSGALVATTNWWGHPTGPLDPSDDTSSGGLFNPGGLGNPVTDGIRYQPFSNVVPLFGLGFTLPEGDLAGDREVLVELRAPTASAFRLSEDPTFAGVPFQPMTNRTDFVLSEGEGLKTIHAQFQAPTGNTASLSRMVRLDTGGPLLALVQPMAGAILSRPVTVLADASDPAGVERVEFLVDGVVVFTDTTNSYSFDWDIRGLGQGTHQLGLRARDTLGRETLLTQSFSISPAPPAAPVITSPLNGTQTASPSLTFTGTAEPMTTVTIRRGAGTVVANALVGVSGTFSVNVAIPEGLSVFTAVASDLFGSSPPSGAVSVLRDSAPPGAPTLFASIVAGNQVRLQWSAAPDDPPAFFRVYSAATSFGTPAGATLLRDGVTVSVLLDRPASDGPRFYGVAAVDGAGNQGPLSNIVQVTFDATAPTAAIVALPAGPVGPGAVELRLTASEALAATPALTVTPAGGTTTLVELSASGTNEWSGVLAVTPATPSGNAQLAFSGSDAAGNNGTQITAGAVLAIDTRGPSGSVALVPSGTVGPRTLAVTLTLDEPAAGVPLLRFVPPAGGPVAIALTGGPTTWTGSLAIAATMGDGAGSFELDATDALGNARSGAVPASPLTLDTTPPATAVGLAAATQPAGAVRLTWTAVAGAASYSLYRLPATATFPDVSQVLVAAGLTTAEHTDTPPTDGTWRWAVAALDEHGNESALSADAAAVSDRTAPAPPADLTLGIEGSGVRATWTAAGAEPTDRYRAFRSTSPIASVEGLTPIGPDLAQATLLDAPPADGAFHYAVVALDVAGNLSAPATAGPLTFDQGAPEITISGVTDGLFTNTDVTPAFSATDFALDTVSATLDGAPFASGTLVTAEGAHVLVVTATDTSARAAERTVSFVIDKTTPVISISGVSDGGVFSGAVTPVIAVADANPGPVTTTLDGAPFVSGTTVAADGNYVLAVATTDRAGNPAQAGASFTLDAAPSPPTALVVLHVDGQSPGLSWTAPPQLDIVGYRVRRNGTLATATPIVGTSFVDAGFAPAAPNAYEVTAVDAGGNESAPARATLSAVALTLESYGLQFDPSSIPVFDPTGGTTTTTAGSDLNALTRRYLDRVTVKLENADAAATTPGAVRFVLRDGAGTLIDRQVASGGPLPAAASRSYTQVVPTGAAPGPSRTLEVEVELPSGGEGVVRRRLVRTLQTRETPLAVEVFSDPLVRGATAGVRVKLLNHGSTPIQLLTATVDNPTPEVEVRLLRTDGTLLSSARLEHRGAGTTVTPSGVYVTIPVGGSFLSPAVGLQIPSIAPDEVRIEAVIAATHHALFTSADVVGSQLVGSSSVSIGDPAYLATAQAERGLYDQGQPVQITGRAFDTHTGDPRPAAVVKVGVSTRGFVRNLFATTDANGDFATTFQPLATEAGAYTLWATHPSVTENGAQDQFQILGLELRPSRVNARFSRNGSVGFPVRLKNTGELPLNGLTASITGGPGISGTVDLSSAPSPLAPGESFEMRVTLNSTIDAPFANFADIELTTADGAVRALAVQIELLEALPTIRTDPTFVDVSVSHDGLVARTIVIRNVGFAPLTGITIDPPSRPWIRLASSSELPAIPPGGAENVTVIFNPDTTIDQGVYGDDIVIRSGNHVPYTVNLFATVTSATRGGVEFEVRNILNELVPGASVSIRSTKVPDLLLNGTTGASGRVLFEDLPTGPYQYKAQATGHEVSISSFTVDPDTIKPLTIFLNVAFVSLEWSVTPVVIADRYDFTLTATFETSVPAPVLTADPPSQKITLAQGSTYLGNMRITNHGLIAADDVQISVGSDPRLLMETLVTSIPRIDAMQSYDVPWRLTRLPDSVVAANAARASGASERADGAQPGVVEISALPPVGTATTSDALDCIKPPAANSCGSGTWVCPAGFSTSSSACSSVTAEEPTGCDAPDCESCAPCSCLGLIPAVGGVAKGICECLSALSDTECITAETVICDCLGAFIENIGDACTCLSGLGGDEGDLLDCLLMFVDPGDLAKEALDAIDNLTDAFTCGVELGLCLLNLDIEVEPGTSVGSPGGGGGWGGWGGAGGGVSGGWYCD